ncbi:MAG TPA: hypothetical protein VGP52_08730 [Stellaceae bacterium]|jgi:hypothetical protein|nr:hypothetical protein [Stellaceae bacterium]
MADFAQQHILARQRITGAYDALRHDLRGRRAARRGRSGAAAGDTVIRIG